MRMVEFKNIETNEEATVLNQWPSKTPKERLVKNAVKSLAFTRVRNLWFEEKRFPEAFLKEEKPLIELTIETKEAFAKEIEKEIQKWIFIENE